MVNWSMQVKHIAKSSTVFIQLYDMFVFFPVKELPNHLDASYKMDLDVLGFFWRYIPS